MTDIAEPTDIADPTAVAAGNASPAPVSAPRIGPPPLPESIGEVAYQPDFLQAAPYRVPADRYTSERARQLEAERLWPRVWQFACTLDEVASPGDAADCRLGGLSVVVVRGADGELRAYQNVCRHRGNVLCQGAQRGLTELRCPYHRWSWDLDGQLREVPSRRGFGQLGTDGLGLLAVAVGTWGPLVFVNPDPAAGALEDWLEGVPADTDWVSLEEFRCVVVARTVVPCNWKIVVDGFSETYHVQGIHREMLGSIDDVHAPQRIWGRHGASYQMYGVASPRLGPEVGAAEVWESFTAVFGARAATDPGDVPVPGPGGRVEDVIAERVRAAQRALGVDLDRYSTEAILRMAQYNLFPNATLLVQADMVNLLVARPGPDVATAELSSYVFVRAADPGAERVPPLVVERPPDADFGLVLNADVGVLLTMQRGVEQPGFTELVLSAEECRIVNFHRHWEAMVEG